LIYHGLKSEGYRSAKNKTKMKTKKFSTEFGGKTLTAEFSNLAEQANGSCLVRYGDTVVMANAVMSKLKREGLSYFPLSVDYEEKFYAAGQILGSRFLRREGRPSDEAILGSRLIDRSIRPLFNKQIRNDIQVVVMALSIDEENDPDVPAVIAASLSLGVSDIPWKGPIGCIRIGLKDGKFLVNPSYKEREGLEIDTIICGKNGKINMIEAAAKEASEENVEKCFELAVKEIDKINEFQKNIIEEIGKEKMPLPIQEKNQELENAFEKHILSRLKDFIYVYDKATRNANLSELKNEWIEFVKENFGTSEVQEADEIYENAIDKIVHQNIIKNEKRVDGRKLDELRGLFAAVAMLPRTHGSGLFFRGETHTLSITTLGSPSDEQLIEGMEIQTKKRFMHHYNFPSFSTGETGGMRGPGRREIGHGALAEKALAAVIPSKEEFPYTIRIVSETMSSNGSTSMAAVCASTLSLMDAGVPIKNPVAGIAMGLMMENENNYKILTDIQGPEDHHGDMDFKAAGTKKGITAIQMDVKIEGVTVKILKDALADAKKAREKILNTILQVINEPRKKLSPFAPHIISHSINPEKIRDLIGPGGKTINGIISETETEIDIEQDGIVYITGKNDQSVKKALEIVKQITREFKRGEKMQGKVTRIFDFGAMVELTPQQEGLIHISKLLPFRVGKVTDVVNIEDLVEVEIVKIDEQGRIDLALIKNITHPVDEETVRKKGMNGFNNRNNHYNKFRKKF
jgi:polyribonucleotide nucleotidyltransferase